MTTLVFFHGWGASGRVWERQAAAFGDRMPVLMPTVPVWEVGWFAEYLQGLDLQECLLVGWSLGGMLLLEALSRLTDPSPGGLVLVGVAPVFTRRPDYPWGQPLGVVRAMRRALTKNMKNTNKLMIGDAKVSVILPRMKFIGGLFHRSFRIELGLLVESVGSFLVIIIIIISYMTQSN